MTSLNKTIQPKKTYIKPSITTQVVQTTFFYSIDPRSADSIDALIGVNLAQGSSGCGASGSKGNETPV